MVTINELPVSSEVGEEDYILSYDGNTGTVKKSMGSIVESLIKKVRSDLGFYGRALEKCGHCGQWGAVMHPCGQCGAPIDPKDDVSSVLDTEKLSGVLRKAYGGQNG